MSRNFLSFQNENRLQEFCSSGVRAALGIVRVSSWILLLVSALPLAWGDESRATEPVSAKELLQHACKNRETFSKEFPGFRSNLAVRLDGRAYHGSMLFRTPATLKIELPEGELPETVVRTVRSMVMHRVPSNRTVDAPARYGKKDDHPLGRSILLDDKYRSSYRIGDNRILQVDRQLTDSRRVLTLLSTETTSSGRYLPAHVSAVLFDKQSGAVREAWTYISRFQEVEGEYLPLSRKVVRTGKGRTSMLLIEWEGIEILDSEIGEGP